MDCNLRARYVGWFTNTAAAILLLTGVAKVLSGLGHAKVLGVPDPILGLPFGPLMQAVGAVEGKYSGGL
jgi:hypothetical protein